MTFKIKYQSPKIIQSYIYIFYSIFTHDISMAGTKVSNDMKNDVEKQRSKHLIKQVIPIFGFSQFICLIS